MKHRFCLLLAAFCFWASLPALHAAPKPLQNRYGHRLSSVVRSSRSSYTAGHAARFNQTEGAIPELKISSNSTLAMGGHTMAFVGFLFLRSIANPNQHIMVKVGGSTGTDEYFLQINSATTLRWGFSNGSSYSVVNWSAALTNGVWYWVYGDWDGATLHLNVNNGTPATLAGTGPINTGTSPLRFGADSGDGVDLNAFLDAWGIWKDRVFTAAEQTLLFNNAAGWRLNTLPASLAGNLVSWWDFDGKSGGIWVDSYGTNDLTDVNNSVVVDAGIN